MAFQFYANMNDDRVVFMNFTSNHDMKLLIVGLAVRQKPVGAVTRVMEDVTIEGLEMIVSKTAANPHVVRGIQTCRFTQINIYCTALNSNSRQVALNS